MSGRGARQRAVAAVAAWLGFASAVGAQPTFPKPPRYEPTADDFH